MAADRNGVATAGLLWMEASWDTAYLWENAEAAQAWLEAWTDTGEELPRSGLGSCAGDRRPSLRRCGLPHRGGGLEQPRHPAAPRGRALYGAINYTEPLLNNLHLVGPTLFYFEKIGYRPSAGMDDAAAIALVAALSRRE